MIELRVSVGSHYFSVTRVNPRARPAIDSFSHSLIQWGFIKSRGRYQREALKVFAASNRSRTEFRYHINHFAAFKEHLKKYFINDLMVEWVTLPAFKAAPAKFVLKPQYQDLEHQIPVIEYLTEMTDVVSKMVEIQTGKGKGYCAMRWMAHKGQRTVIQILPRFIDKWVEELKEKLDIDPKRIVTVNGSKQLMSLLNLAGEDFPYDII
ncbi:MAG TPA: hypothetical protein V6C65_22385, partial [Allocoleopsis sp.]